MHAIVGKDIDFSASPTRIHIRKEYSKTRTSRDIYISDEATYYLKQWLDWKYKDKEREVKEKLSIKHPNSEDLVFSIYSIKEKPNPSNLYVKLLYEFQKLLAAAGMAERKEGGIHKRRKITLHSMRRFCKGVISNQANQDYSEWFLGHSKSPYYTLKEPERREIYATKVMKYLTFLDYTTLEATGRNIEAKLSEKEREIQQLRKSKIVISYSYNIRNRTEIKGPMWGFYLYVFHVWPISLLFQFFFFFCWSLYLNNRHNRRDSVFIIFNHGKHEHLCPSYRSAEISTDAFLSPGLQANNEIFYTR